MLNDFYEWFLFESLLRSPDSSREIGGHRRPNVYRFGIAINIGF
jgi:hypothetical protein